MKILGNNRSLNGQLHIPGDKSISHRSIILLSISEGVGKIENILFSEDVNRTIEIFKAMGVDIHKEDDNLIINGVGINGLEAPTDELYCGNSGTTMRLLAGLLIGQKFDSILTGDESLSQRPMDRIIKPLEIMNGRILSREGKAPLNIKGGEDIRSIDYEMSVASAQVKSAILLAGLYSSGKLTIRERGVSRNHTENMLRYLGIGIETNENIITMSGNRKMKSRNIFVPGDISSAGYFIVGASILDNSSILLKNMGINGTRDGIIDVISKMDGDIEIKNIRYVNDEKMADIHVKSSNLEGITIDGNTIGRLIDEVPIIAVAASFASGITKIESVSELRVKETDRLEAIISELSRAGVNIWSDKDDLYIKGGDNYCPSNFKSYDDHRIAMAMSIFALKCEGVSEIDDVDCINISYPNFYRDLELFLN